MKQRKGQIGSLQGIIATLVVLGLLIAAAFMLIGEFQEADKFSSYSYSVSNETGTYANASGYTLNRANDPGFNSPVITAAWNGTGALSAEVPVGNFTVSSGGVVTNATSNEWMDLSLAYTYNRGEQGYVSLNETIDAMSTIPALLGLIVLIALIGVILAVLFSIIPGTRTTGA